MVESAEYIQMTQATWDAINQTAMMYQIVTLLLVFVCGIGFITFRPFIPYAISKLITHNPVIGMMTKNRNIVFWNGFSYRNGMYHYKDKPLYFVKRYSEPYFIAGVPFEVAHLDMAFIQSPKYNQFVRRLKELGYNDINDLETALDFNNIKQDDPHLPETLAALGFETYEEAKMALNPAGLTRESELVAPFFHTMLLDELVGYGAEVPPSDIAGEVEDIIESRKQPIEKTLIDWMPWVILLFIIIIGGLLIGKGFHFI